jgi:hypothetical protein
MPIRTYGLFWQRDEVLWRPGAGNGGFKLLGRRGERNPNLRVADFRAQKGLYALHSAYGAYYVGLVSRGGLGNRLKQHLNDDHGKAWDRFSWFGFRPVLKGVDKRGYCQLRELASLNADESMSAIKDMEALLINVMNPPGNERWMNFTNAERWEQLGADDEARYRRRLGVD